MNNQNTAAHDLGTSAGGRVYIAEYFATQLRRHDFARYIENTLAADFACALAQHLSKLRAPVADELVDSLARYAYYYAVDLDRHTRNADLDQLEGISRRATAKLKAEIRATLTSAQVDPEAAEVDFMVRVFENLDTWRAEDWNELLERRPAILALLRPMVLASAPVAGEAVAEVQIDPHSPPDDERAIIVPLVDFEAVDAGTKLYAAAQASEAVRDALRSAAQQITDLYEGDEWPELAQVLHVLDALSSQPGAQKGGNDA